MKIIINILFLSLVWLTGCTTIGQQITNHSGTIQIEQRNIPLTAQADSNTIASLQPFNAVSDLQHYSTPIKQDVTTIKVPTTQVISNTVTFTNSTNNTIPVQNNVQMTNLPVNKVSNETNNVTVNVYTDTVNIKNSSFLSDAFNYFFSE